MNQDDRNLMQGGTRISLFGTEEYITAQVRMYLHLNFKRGATYCIVDIYPHRDTNAFLKYIVGYLSENVKVPQLKHFKIIYTLLYSGRSRDSIRENNFLS